MRLRNKTPTLSAGVPTNQELANAIGVLVGKPGLVQESIHPAVAGEDVDSLSEDFKFSRFMEDWFTKNEDLREALERVPPMEIFGFRAGLVIELGSRVERVAVPQELPKLDGKSLHKIMEDAKDELMAEMKADVPTDELLGEKKAEVTDWEEHEMHYLILVNPSQSQGDRERNPGLESCTVRIIKTDGRGPDDGFTQDLYNLTDLTVDQTVEPHQPKFTLAGVRRATLAALQKKAVPQA